MLSPWPGIALVLAIFLSLLISVGTYQARRSPHPELARKVLHLGMGFTTLSFPWLFHTAWPVWLLAACSMVTFASLKHGEPLRRLFGGVVGGVPRDSAGEHYFALGTALLWTLSHGHPLLFCIPMLILTLGDAVGALVGVRYGQLHYTAGAGVKSIEGSIACFTAAFLGAHLPLLLAGAAGRLETVIIAANLALAATLLEAVSGRGLDNLFIPLGCLVLLRSYLVMGAAALGAHLAGAGLVVTAICCGRGRRTLTKGAVLRLVLAGYLAWILSMHHT